MNEKDERQDCNETIGKNIKALRNNKCWTQKKLSIELNKLGYDIGPNSVAQIEGGYQNIDALLMKRLRKLFGLTSYDIFFCKEKECDGENCSHKDCKDINLI